MANDYISNFINLCDEFCEKNNTSRTTLSRKLLSGGNRLEQIANGESTITLRVLEEALAKLTSLQEAAAQKREGANG